MHSNADRGDGHSAADKLHPRGYNATPTVATMRREEGVHPPTYDTYSAADTVAREYANHPPPEDT